MFSNYGTCVCRKRGRMYERIDFNSNFFSNNNFVFCNKFNECVCIDFPVYMYSCVKFTRFSDRVDFSETVVITLIKKDAKIMLIMNYINKYKKKKLYK